MNRRIALAASLVFLVLAGARADDPPPAPAIDYLAAVEDESRAATRRRINYAALTGDGDSNGGQSRDDSGSDRGQDSHDEDSHEEMP